MHVGARWQNDSDVVASKCPAIQARELVCSIFYQRYQERRKNVGKDVSVTVPCVDLTSECFADLFI